MTRQTLFEEESRFRSGVRRGIVVLAAFGTLAVLAVFGYGLHRQLVRGIPWGDASLSDGQLILLACAMCGAVIAAAATIILVTYKAYFRIRVTDKHVDISRYPGRDVRLHRHALRSWRALGPMPGIQLRYRLGQGWLHQFGRQHGVAVTVDGGREHVWCTSRPQELGEALDGLIRRPHTDAVRRPAAP